jgi:hypothetical protein
MSSEEYEVEWSEGSQKDDGRSEGEVEIANNFYEAEGILKEEPREALEKFTAVVMMEEGREM